MKITVKVPATSANLGSAFDVGGIAFGLYNCISFAPSEKLIIKGCDERYRNENNMAYLAYEKVLEKLGENGEVEIDFEKTEIPVTRGLGSSAALIVAGAYSANALYGNKLSKEELLNICTEIEGHPDNVAPALYGGLCLSIMGNGKVFCVKSEVSDKIKFTAIIPEFKVSTKEARKALPVKIPFKSAVFNSSRTALLAEAFKSGNMDLIAEVTKDKLHQNYRKKLYKNADEVEKISKEIGAKAFFVSGAGPTQIAVSETSIASKLNERLKGIENGWKAIELTADNFGATEI